MINKKITLIVVLALAVVLVFIVLNNKEETILEDTSNIIINNGSIDLSSLTLKQKLAQMIMVRGDKKDLRFNQLNVGGIFLDRQYSEERYHALINEYQNTSNITLLVATDLEGTWNPFHEKKDYQKFPKFSEISSAEEAHDIGFRHGKLLESVGFNLNFAPVAEYYDDVYGGRAFLGTDEEISDKIEAYIGGLQESVSGTCKHYPGRALEKNLHKVSDTQEISERDLSLFELCIRENISAIMVSHQVAEGVLDSNGRPSSVSEEVIKNIEGDTLVIADEINMKGLSIFYEDKIGLYVDLINSGENLILDFDLNPGELNRLLDKVVERINGGEISIEKVDNSVIKILEFKGYSIIQN